jgi:hypothetical protein
MALGALAGAAGRGLLAGLVGTAAMTVSSTLEAKLRGREPSTTPAQAVGKVLGIEPRDAAGQRRLNTVAHWGYGTALGATRGLIAATGLRGAAATGAHFGKAWGGAMIMLPALDLAPPPWEWEPTEIAVDAFHHAVYAIATGLVYDRLSG